MRVVVAVTGASGVVYAHALLRHLNAEVDLILTPDAEAVIRAETDWTPEDFRELATRVHRNEDMGAEIASGSCRFDAMVVVPCSGTTLSKIATGIADNLVTRVAAVCLKERRRLILVPRETPLSPPLAENMARLVGWGAVVLPASPGFYTRPRTLDDLVAFVTARILDQLGVSHKLSPRWTGSPPG